MPRQIDAPALVAAVFLTFACTWQSGAFDEYILILEYSSEAIVAEALHTNSTLRARNRKRAKQTDLYDEGRSEPYDQYQFR